MANYFYLCFEKRPAEELFDLKKDPDQVKNVAGRPEYASAAEEDAVLTGPLDA